MGLFNRTKKETAQQENPEFLALVEKWDSFLEKIKTRYFESLVNAEEALMDNLEESNYDLNPTLRAWQGIKSQLMSLGDKAETTFDEKVKPQMLAYHENYELLDQDAKATYLREKIILNGIERFEIVLEGKVATKFYNHAIAFLNKDFNCTQCSAKLEVNKNIFHAHYVSCDYCNTVNTFTPNDKILQIRWVVDNMSKYKALNEWDEKRKAEMAMNELRSWSKDMDIEPFKNALKTLEDAKRSFWLKYFTERAKYLPEYNETIQHDIDVKMKWFYEKRKREYNY